MSKRTSILGLFTRPADRRDRRRVRLAVESLEGRAVPTASAVNTLTDTVAINLPGGGQEVFGIGSDHTVQTRTQAAPGGSWSSSSLGGWVSAIAVGTNANGTLEVFGIGNNNAVSTRTQTAPGASTWSGWTSLGGWVSAIAVGTNYNGALEVFAIGSNHAVYTTTQTTPGASTWSGWQDLGGWLSTISVSTNSFGTLEVSGIGSDGALYATYEHVQGGSFTFGEWLNLSATLTTTQQVDYQGPLEIEGG